MLKVASLLLFLSVLATASWAQDARGESPENKTQSSSASAPSAQKAESSSNRVILKVGAKPVTEAEFETSVGDIEPKGGDPDKGGPGKDRRELGDDYASVLMLSQLAVTNHLDSSPDIRQKLAVARMQILSDAMFSRLLDQTKPTSDELNLYYQSHLSDFDRAQVRRLFIWKVGNGSKNTRGLAPDDANARAAAILQASASGGDAVKLAEMFKESDQGIFDAQPLTFVRGQLPPSMDKVAFSIKPGTWAEAENTSDHIILIYLAGRERPPLSDVKSLVEKAVHGNKMQAKINELKKKTGIWMDEKYFGGGSAVVKDRGE
jgi:parvulin-like peptidyl-prolyl isomerase